MLSAKQIEDWKDLTVTEKDLLKQKRKDSLSTEFDSGNAAGRLFKRISNDTERAKLPDTILTHADAAQYLNTNVLAKIVDNDSINETHRRQIKQNVMDYHSNHPDAVQYRQDLAAYNALPPAQRPGQPPAQPDILKKMDKFEQWFDKNNAGQRY
jgi:hypothetical protein